MRNQAPARGEIGAGLTWRTAWLFGFVALAAGALVAAPPPQGKTYFAINLGIEGPFATGVDCWRFSANGVCTSSGLCGSWERTGPAGSESGFAFEFSYEQQGTRVEIEGEGRVDSRGPRDSASVAARARIGGKSINFAVAGRSTTPGRCTQLRREWTRKSPPEQPEQTPACLEHAGFGSPADSPYVLPFPVDGEYRLSQTYCYAGGGHRTWLAYDFALEIGDEVIAARAGRVRDVRDDVSDEGSNDPNAACNQVWIEHDDGTAAFYCHLRQHGVVVQTGQQVEQGELLGYSGNSGWTGGFPHLHFQVLDRMPLSWPPTLEAQVPVSFRNALGPLDRRAGLIQNVLYKALADR